MNRTNTQPKYAGPFAQFFRYAGVGGVASLVDWALFGVFYGTFSMHYLPATALSLMAGALVGYWLSLRFVFERGTFSRSAEIFLVCSVSTVGLIMNAGLMLMLVESLGFSPVTAKIAATFGVFCWNFLSRRHFVFSDDPFRFLGFLSSVRDDSAPSRELLVPARSEQNQLKNWDQHA